jgi:anthranilate synthase
MRTLRYETRSGIAVSRSFSKAPYKRGLKHLLRKLDRHRGFYLSSGYEYPGRYSRWDIASILPPLEIVSAGRHVEFRALNQRGEMLCQIFARVLQNQPYWESFTAAHNRIDGLLQPLPALFPEEERSKQPSVFSVLRTLVEEFRHPEDSRLSLIGAFGFDLLFQFDPIELKLPRDGHKDLHLFFCDDIYYMDRKKEQIERYQYDFDFEFLSTRSLPRDGESLPKPPRRKNTWRTSKPCAKA